MGNVKIIGETLRNLRKKKGWSQEQLGKAAGVSARQISRIEKGGIHKVRDYTVERLSKALGVSHEELAKEKPANGKYPFLRRIPIPLEVLGQMRMVEHLYGLSIWQQLHLAPLLIALVGEWSKLWRKQKLEELQEAVDEVYRLADKNSALSFASLVSIVENGIGGAEEALEKRGPYDPEWAKEIEKWTGWDDIWEDKHPFMAFLLHLLQETNARHIEIHNTEDVVFPEARYGYEIGSELVEKLAADDYVTRSALLAGFVSPSEIPEDLWPQEDDDLKAEDRKQFVRQRLPEQVLQHYEKMQEGSASASIDELLKEIGAISEDKEG